MPQALATRGSIYQTIGRHDLAAGCFDRALQADPNYLKAAIGRILLALHADSAPQNLTALIRALGERVDRLIPASTSVAHSNDPAPDRKLKLALVSPDFRLHPIRFFLLPVLRQIDRDRFEILLFSDVAPTDADADTHQFEQLADGWFPVAGLPDAAVAQQLRDQRVDVLIDLAGLTLGNRLLMLARRPAPVQMTWLGFPGSTGLQAVDYRITDAIADPRNMTDALHAEQLIRLPGPFFCYAPPEASAAPSEGATAGERGAITFACFNQFAKITQPMRRLWYQILRTCPGSRLVLKSPVFAEPMVRAGLEAEAAEQQITPQRVVLTGPSGFAEYLAELSRADIFLDTFPFNGHTTTCHALWMGTPFVTLAGQTPASRLGASILTHTGLSELIADTPQQYVDLAVALAADPQRIAELRATMRQRLERSSITDYRCFTRGSGDNS